MYPLWGGRFFYRTPHFDRCRKHGLFLGAKEEATVCFFYLCLFVRCPRIVRKIVNEFFAIILWRAKEQSVRSGWQFKWRSGYKWGLEYGNVFPETICDLGPSASVARVSPSNLARHRATSLTNINALCTTPRHQLLTCDSLIKDQSDLAKGEIAVASPLNSSFVFSRCISALV